MDTFHTALDLSGTFVFALSGGMAGVRHKLDIFGVLVLSFTAANAGGIARDAMIGATPVAALSDWRYVAVSLAAGLLTFYGYQFIDRLSGAVLIFDAAGLALFAVTGATKALAYHLGPVAAALLGMLTGIGGGMMRDILITEVPVVLRADLYAVAALAGAAVVVMGSVLHVSSDAAMIVGALLCFGLRFMAIRYGWKLPVAAGGRPIRRNNSRRHRGDLQA
ncbi:MAG: trimeric intracellular cation channel family protein [Candidatus Angelobacter sp.]